MLVLAIWHHGIDYSVRQLTIISVYRYRKHFQEFLVTIVIAKRLVPVVILATFSSERPPQDSRGPISPPPARKGVALSLMLSEDDVPKHHIPKKMAIEVLQTLRLHEEQ